MTIGKYFCIVLIMTVFSSGSTMWVETSQEDFCDGIYESNLYVSMKDGGTIELTSRWDLNGDGFLDIVVSNERASISYVYWGSASGYSSSNRTEYAVICGGDVETVDLDFDGCPELIFSSCTGNYIRVFRGTSSGPNPADYFDLPVHVWNESCCIADCDKDGYLDIIVARYTSGYGAIYWGSEMGYSPGDLTLLSAMGAHNFETGDFNKDGWIDILFEQQNGGISIVYLGSASGYSQNNTYELVNPGSNTHGSSVADLNGDGMLDIVLTCFGGSSLYIYTGSNYGFTLWQELSPGPCYGGSSITDMNDDGFLDIVCTPGYGVQQHPMIYWGSSAGYSQSNKTEIGVPSDASGLLVADFDVDGYLDVLIHNYAYPPQSSYILRGPDFTPTYDLPTGRDHHGRFREIGNVYNREYYEDYISSVFDAGATTDWGTIEWDAYEPSGTVVFFWVRTGNTPVPDQSWSEWESVSNGDSIPAKLNARYIQYKACLSFTNPCFLPMLKQVSIGYGSTAPLLAEVRIEPEVINLHSHGEFAAFITLPPGYNPFNIDISTVECEGAPAVYGHTAPQGLFYIAKFRVKDLIGVAPGQAVQFAVTGYLFDGTAFIGYDTVRVIGHDDMDLYVTPNPFKIQTSIMMTCSANLDISVRIYSVNGALVRDFCIVSGNNNTATIMWDRYDNKGFFAPAGVYFIKVQDDETSSFMKVIILD